MRYYVVCKSDVDRNAPHIIAEVVRDRINSDRNITLAFALAGERRVVATRAELLEHALGRAALEAWEADDDSAFDDDCVALCNTVERRFRGLRLVKTAQAE